MFFRYIPPHMRKGPQRGGMRGMPPARQNSGGQPSPKAVPHPTPPQWPTPTQYDEAHRVNGGSKCFSYIYLQVNSVNLNYVCSYSFDT